MIPVYHVYYTDTTLMPHDIYPMQYGEQDCVSGYSFGPCVRNHFFLHYVYRGKGKFKTEGNTYHLHAGQAFLIYPGQLTYYEADTDDPWFYRWIEFNGDLSESLLNIAGLSHKSPVFTDRADLSAGNALKTLVSQGKTDFEILMAYFWHFIAAITAGNKMPCLASPADEYIRKAETYIHLNLHKKISVTELSEFVGINRSYLSRLFQRYKGLSTQQYIIRKKLDTAAQYLNHKNLSVKEVANSVGYHDPLEFSKAFKSRFNLSPTQWRGKAFWEQSVKE